MQSEKGLEIGEFVRQVFETCPELTSVWLIGSRANDSARETSDWDLLAFGSDKALACLRQHRELHRPDVDFLIVINGDDFVNAWGDRDKSGSLAEWKWMQKSGDEAEYMEVKSTPGANYGGVTPKLRRAVRLWPAHS